MGSLLPPGSEAVAVKLAALPAMIEEGPCTVNVGATELTVTFSVLRLVMPLESVICRAATYWPGVVYW
jgi:hypothetical protein